jgi:hypothetical protein
MAVVFWVVGGYGIGVLTKRTGKVGAYDSKEIIF